MADLDPGVVEAVILPFIQEGTKWSFDDGWKRLVQESSGLPLTVGDGSIQIGSPWNLTFTGSRLVDEFGTAFSNPNVPGQPNFLDNTGVVLLGLATPGATTSQNFSLANLLEKLSADLKGGPLKELLPRLETSANVEILEGEVGKPSTRNGLWCVPSIGFELSLHLTFKLEVDSNGFRTYLQDLFKWKVPLEHLDMTGFTCEIRWTVSKPKESAAVVISSEISFILPIAELQLTLNFNEGNVNIGLTQLRAVAEQGDALTHKFLASLAKISPEQIGKQVGDAPMFLSSSDGEFPKIFDQRTFDLWKVAIGRPTADELNLELGFLLDLNFGVVSLYYNSEEKSYSGSMLFNDDAPDPLSPTFSTSVVSSKERGEKLKLQLRDAGLAVFRPSASPPAGLPKFITKAKITYKHAIDKDTLVVELALAWREPGGQPSASKGVPDLAWNALLGAIVIFEALSLIEIRVTGQLDLEPKSPTIAKLDVTLHYNSNEWDITGKARDVPLAYLARYFGSSAVTVGGMLGTMNLKVLDVRYLYVDGIASSFAFTGDLELGKLALLLFFQYGDGSATTAAMMEIETLKNGRDPATKRFAESLNPIAEGFKGWQLEAYLGGANAKANLGGIIDSIVQKDGHASPLPPFLRNIQVDQAAGKGSPVGLLISETSNTTITPNPSPNPPTGPASKPGVIFLFWIKIDRVKFVLAQIKLAEDASSQITPAENSASETKRMLRITVDNLPNIGKVPLIGQVPQPYDELQYLWADLDFDQKDLDAINSHLESPRLAGSFKNVSTKRTTQETKEPIQAGHHFIVIDKKGNMVVDHLFGTPDEDPMPPARQNNGGMAILSANTPAEAQQDEAKSEKPPSTGALEYTLGPVKVSGIGIQFKKGILWINMDVTVTLTPLMFALRGFGIGLKLSKFQLDDLSSLVDPDSWELQLRGAGISMNQPPLLIAGLFEHEDNDLAHIYRGGIGLSYAPYTFVAVGEYQEMKKDGYKSMFVFARLDGSLVTLAFATISGVRIGFGYNSIIRSPSLQELSSFPMLSDSGVDGAGNSPITMLDNFKSAGWVMPKQDSYWAAAGLTVTAFDVLSITAVAIFSFRENSVAISVLAVATAQMPPGVERELSIVYLKVDMIAEMNFIDGYFRVEASIDPTSFLLVPQCALHGGFALVYWYDHSPYAGDWVFSAGGYHPAYQKPPHYPAVDRLGFSFRIGGVSVEGNGYFAITPKCVMGGGHLGIFLKVGPVRASAEAEANFFINYKPFHYIGDISVSVKVQFKADVGFIHIRVSVSVGASLHIEGPEFGGTAHVDFHLYSFSIDFGAHRERPEAILLKEFWELTRQPGPASDPRPKDQVNKRFPYLGNLKFALEDGNYPLPAIKLPIDPDGSEPETPSEGVGSSWTVRGGSFRFRLNCDFAISTAQLITGTSKPSKAIPGDTPAFYSSPMQISQIGDNGTNADDKGDIKSVLTLTVLVVHSEGPEVILDTSEWNAKIVQKAVPTALWKSYSQTDDPMNQPPGAPPPSHVVSAEKGTSTMDLAMAVSIASPPAKLSQSSIPPFNAEKANNARVDGSPALVRVSIPQKSFQIATLVDHSKPVEQWQHFAVAWAEAWEKPNKPPDATDPFLDLQQTIVDLCTVTLGWDNPPADQIAKAAPTLPLPTPVTIASADPVPVARKPWDLTAKLPAHLLDGFKKFYLALPRSTRPVGA